MGIDLATWRVRIGLNYYHMCRPLQTRWRSNGSQLYQPGVGSWGVREVMNDTPLVLKACMTVVALSLILLYKVYSWCKLKGKDGGGKVCCYWQGFTFQAKGTVKGGVAWLLRAIVVMIPLLLVIAGDVELNPGPQGTALTLKAAINALHSVSDKWYKIGVQLEVPVPNLKNISRDSMDPLCDTLDFWMRNSPSLSWRCLVDALKAPNVGENRLAEEIEVKYCCPEMQSTCDVSETSVKANSHREVSSQDNKKATPAKTFPSPAQASVVTSGSPIASAAIHSSSTAPPHSEGSQKPPFGCGCGKCTFFSFIERGCPTPIPSASSFPFLDLGGLTHKEQQDLRGRLQFESQQIMIRFQELVSATIESLSSRNVSCDKLVSHVMTLGAFKPVVKEPPVPLFQYCFQKLEAADTVPKVFLVLKDYFSFFNYHVIEHIIKTLGTEEDKTGLQRYKDDFHQYAKRRIFECQSEFGPVSDADHADIFVKVDIQYENYTISEIEVFRHKLSEILRVSSQGILRLCRVEEGCIQFIFQVPLFVQEEIFPLSAEQEITLKAEGVIKIICQEYQFLVEAFKPRELLPVTDTESDDKNHEVVHEAITMKPHLDIDKDLAMGFSVFTGGKSLTLSEDPLDRELEVLDYELTVQGLAEPASTSELHNAIWTGQMQLVKFIIEEKDYNPMLKNDKGVTALHVAANAGSLVVLQYFITEKNCNPATPGPLGLTPLHLASQQGHLDIVKYLVVEQQIDPLCEDEYGNTPLHRACAGGCQKVVEFLTSELAKYTPIIRLMKDLTNKWNGVPIHSAVLNGHLNIIQFFISDQNCDPSIPGGQYGRTSLHTAAEFGHLHIVKYLTDEQGCNPSCLDDLKYTPLHCAAMKGHVNIVKYLTIEKLCDPMCRDSAQNNSLHRAVLGGHIEVVKFLTLEMNCDPTCRNANNDTALHLAVEKGHLDILQFFISDLNCDPNIPGGQYDGTPLHYAAECGHLHIVKYLTDERGCNPSCLSKDNLTPLHCATWKGYMDIVKFLTVEKHCDPMCTDSDQVTPLHLAALCGQIEVVKLLTLEMHCNPISRNADNDSALHLAAVEGHLNILQFFISDQKYDPNIPGQYGRTPLHYAAQFGHLHIVMYLTDERGCNPSSFDHVKCTPLHLAAMEGHVDIVKFLSVTALQPSAEMF